MSKVTFDSTDNPEAIASRKESEAQSLAIGEKLVSEQEAAEVEVYEQARKQAESQINYAGKFRSAEDLEKAYLELEKKLGQSKQQDETNATDLGNGSRTEEGREASEEEEGTDDDDAEGSAEGQGQEDGEKDVQVVRLTPEEEQELLQGLGGLDFYNQAIKWAGENLSQEEIAAYDNILSNGDRGTVTFAVKSLVQQFKANGDYDGAPVSGKAVKGQGVKPFRSNAELARAINNPKYSNDPAYRLDVEQRLAASGELL
jgi:hypothetical protein